MESHSLERIKLDAPLRRTTDQTMSYQFAHDETDLKQRSDGRQTDMARKDRGALLAPEDLQADVSARRPKSRGEELGDAFAAQRYSHKFDTGYADQGSSRHQSQGGLPVPKSPPVEEMMARFKPNRAEKKTTAAGMTVGEFIGAARSVAEMKAIVLESYVRCFRRIVADVARIARPRSRFDFKKAGRIA